MIEVIAIAVGSDNYSYLVICQSHAFVVDPSDASAVMSIVEKRKVHLAIVFNTHAHFDHVGGNGALKKATGCEIIGSDSTSVPHIDRVIHGKDTIKIGPMEVCVIATPGHTRNDVSYYMPVSPMTRSGHVWTGDTLFTGGCGRIGYTAQILYDSLMRLASLPDDTRVYCGHEYTVENYEFAAMIEPKNKCIQQRLFEMEQLQKSGQPTVPSTIKIEKMTNPFLRAASVEVKEALGMIEANAVDIFTELRHRKDRF